MFQKDLEAHVRQVDSYLAQLFSGNGILIESMNYSLAAGGKRIRPVLALAAAKAVGGDEESILPAACALELIHTYSLIHDDLPAMDNDDYRRGRLSNHKAFGVGQAILAGDALLTYAFELLAQSITGVTPERQLRVIREVAQAAGPEGMVGGQVLDLAAEEKDLALAELERVHRLKTGAMLVVSARLGAILAGGTEEKIEALTNYAQAIGLAFQIRDDILDLEGDSKSLGKPAQSDIRQHKATYPSLMGIEGAKAEFMNKTDEAHAALETLGERSGFLHDLADYIAQRKY
ncbi:geranylgeranyl pyrophosphate synthase [Desulfitobacterium dichloroeliminans LMG P-21439]|uniref:Farnesyl diphosphate synthase n=1 Tax=Desulfitobacterium dichloroeliminans (strain LMG P-21439 / DCA1) TaxID=871963 RepID=L0FA66_DESDL|nr:farnesyl diphosphate synthase [Desulfitobacterium dichloroeliminans]AGA69843.1 geranylgeranyl pyrophosphate synthase [Desulfitobacterium dichloroeliminans LMG P-21439]